jgi:hypothetical protein
MAGQSGQKHRKDDLATLKRFRKTFSKLRQSLPNAQGLDRVERMVNNLEDVAVSLVEQSVEQLIDLLGPLYIAQLLHGHAQLTFEPPRGDGRKDGAIPDLIVRTGSTTIVNEFCRVRGKEITNNCFRGG